MHLYIPLKPLPPPPPLPLPNFLSHSLSLSSWSCNMITTNMKLHAYHSPARLLFLLLVFILSINTTKATPSLQSHDPNQERDEVVKMDEFSQVLDHSGEMEGEGPWNLMGLEHCDDGDEECLKRRLISEAHLDYIYTQHHKQP